MVTLTDKQIDTLYSKGIEEGDYIPNTSLKFSSEGVLFGGKDTSYTPTYSSGTVPNGESGVVDSTGTSGTLADLQLKTYNPYISQAQQEANDIALDLYNQSQEPFDARAAYRERLRMHQDEIDAINDLYRARLNEARAEGRGRIGSATALQARSGLSGSSFAHAQRNRVENYNADIAGAIRSEQAMKIGSIMGEVRKSVLEEQQAKVLAKQQGAEDYIAFLSEKSARQHGYLQNFLASVYESGEDIESWDLEEVARSLGTTSDQIRTEFAKYKSEADARGIAEARSIDLKEREMRVKEEKNRIDEAYNDGRLSIDQYEAITARLKEGRLSGEGDSYISQEEREALLLSGWNETEIDYLEENITKEGFEEVYNKEKEGGATESQLSAMRSAFGGSTSLLSRENLSTLFLIPDDDEKASGAINDDKGWFEDKTTNKEYLDAIEEQIDIYRKSNYTDPEILEILREN